MAMLGWHERMIARSRIARGSRRISGARRARICGTVSAFLDDRGLTTFGPLSIVSAFVVSMPRV